MVARESAEALDLMSKSAFVFPGQGSQYVGMAKDLNQQNAEARRLVEMADEVLGFPLSTICFEGPEEELRQTKNTQPAIFLHSVVLSKLYGGPAAAMAAGHSLGEYSALVYADALTFQDGLKIVRLRGELMQQAGVEQQGTMAAVVGLEPRVIQHVCDEASVAGVVQAANFNSPGQIVISGSVNGVRRAMEIAKTRGAKLVKELPVSGAFHSPLMEAARNGLKRALDSTEIRDAGAVQVARRDGRAAIGIGIAYKSSLTWVAVIITSIVTQRIIEGWHGWFCGYGVRTHIRQPVHLGERQGLAGLQG